MTVFVKKSTDSGAPTLSGTAGSLIAVLDWALVTAAGWTKIYSGTNLAAYQAPVGGLRHVIRVDDTATTTASLRAYKTMSDINTGTDAYPTTSQVAGAGIAITKSGVADATARQYAVYATDRSFYLLTYTNAGALGTNAYTYGAFFGDLSVSYKPSDAYHSVLMAGQSMDVWKRYANTASASTGHYISRAHDQTTISQPLNKSIKSNTYQATGFGRETAASAYPDPVTGGIKLAQIEILEPCTPGTLTTWTERGRMPGLFVPLHVNFGAQGDTFPGAGALSGVSFELVFANTPESLVFQTTGSWY